MNWKRKLRNSIDAAFEFIPESEYEEFYNSVIQIIFKFCGVK